MIAVDRLLGTPADEVMRLQDAHLDARGRARRDRITKLQRRLGTEALVGRSFATLAGEAAPWHPTLPIMLADGSTEPASKTLCDLVTVIRDAAILALLQLTGMRIGEIVTLRAGFDPQTGIPTCVTSTRSSAARWTV
ncbi:MULTISPECIES: site-specific integrase [unclassified Sphingomonas]|jgi:hypothetical protein|nr:MULTISPECIES: site-specific integrase [unclassified Sphingomonas]